MNFFFRIWFLSVVVLIATTISSCSDDKTNIGLGSGTISVEVVPDGNFATTGSLVVSPETVVAPSPDTFDIIITDAEGKSAVWNDIDEMGAPQRLLPGRYTLKAIYGEEGVEGFNTPSFVGSSTAVVEHGQNTIVEITATLSSALVDVEFEQDALTLCQDISATLHSESGLYCPYKPSDQGALFLRPGNVEIFISMSIDGRPISFKVGEIKEAKAATYYRVIVDASRGSDGIISVIARISDGSEYVVPLTTAILSSSGPHLSCVGFDDGETLSVLEGGIPDSPIKIGVDAEDLAHLYLSVIAPTLGSVISSVTDLANLTAAARDTLYNVGLRMTDIHPGKVERGEVDLTGIVSRVRYLADSYPSRFSLLAVDKSGLVSNAVSFAIEVKPVQLVIESVSKAIIGYDKAQIEFTSPSPFLSGKLSVERHALETGKWESMPIDTIESLGSNRWKAIVSVPEGRASLSCRMLFFDVEQASFTIDRETPRFSLRIDPFALHANMIVEAEDTALSGIVASDIQFYRIDKSDYELIQMIERFPAENRVVISGLKASSTYRLYASLIESPKSFDDLIEIPEFRTEAASQLPNSDFEDVKFSSIKYKDMLSGGRYSQNSVEIFNYQNRTSFDLMTPEKWANVNNKTFCLNASYHNTWYLAPSTYTVTDAYSGAYAVRMDCVGYDLNGAPIPDYLQSTQPYTPYSRNIPSGYEKAAGRLFLGSYSFDPHTNSEHYNEGLNFDSRPAALNGFYKFVATSANPKATALARVEILAEIDGVEVVLAHGELHLPVSLSYTAFSIPLSYTRFGVKASSIRIHFAPSDAIGSIESETQSIIVIPDPATSTSRGSSLWIDNLSLSY